MGESRREAVLQTIVSWRNGIRLEMDRRTMLKYMVAASVTTPFVLRQSKPERYVPDPKRDRIPQRGEEFNESFLFPDEATGRETRRLTSFRQFNQKPTYHINAGFSPDNNHLCFNTWNAGDGSALVRVNVETGDCKVLDSAKPGDSF